MFLGIDTGGTFTDFVLFDGGELRVHKVLSTPEAPEQAILQGIQELGACLPTLHITHGSTVATNTVLGCQCGVRAASMRYIVGRPYANRPQRRLPCYGCTR